MARMNIPDEYVNEVKRLIERRRFDDIIQEARRRKYERFSYAYTAMLRDSEYRIKLDELQKGYLDKYKKEYDAIIGQEKH